MQQFFFGGGGGGEVIHLTVKIQNKIVRIMVWQNLQLQVEVCLKDSSTVPCH
jgi:hypothetical protein